MKKYPTISREVRYGVPVYAFDKLDGSNIRAEWVRKKTRFFKYGSRTRLIDERHPFLGESISRIQDKYEEALAHLFEKARYNKVIAFFEFWGPGSFAGWHKTDEAHDVVLIDVLPYKHGVLNPDEFLDTYGPLGVPNLVYRGNMNHEVEKEIRESKMPGVSFEGVVCKMKANGKVLNPEMFKVKTYAWLQKLKDHCKGDEALYQKLI